MRTIHTDEITKCIKEMCMQVNVDLSPDVKNALLAGKQKEESPIGKQILEQLEQNLEIAKKISKLQIMNVYQFVRIPV